MAAIFGMGVAFCWGTFGEARWVEWCAAAMYVMTPSVLLALGTGWLAGSVHRGLVYVAIAGFFALAYAPGWQGFNPISTATFVTVPKAMEMLDPVFALPAGMWVGRLALIGIGFGLLAMAFWGNQKEKAEKTGVQAKPVPHESRQD